MTYLFIFIILCFSSYIIATRLIIGQTNSVSDTAYGLESIKKHLGNIFTIWCFIIGICEIPLLIELIKHTNYTVFAFTAGFGLCLVGAAPMFKSGLDKPVHITGAIMSAVSSIAIVIILNYYYIILIGVLISIIIDKRTKQKDTIYWLELATFISVFIVQGIHYLG